jgi:sensor histidine kinase regulating citrate/malate metabolism
MLKNALEATPENEVVEMGVKSTKDGIMFWVQNPGVMPRDVQLQVFQRSFSTKGHNRGLGTYSMKLIAERYLKGKIDFVSKQGTGTNFFILLAG